LLGYIRMIKSLYLTIYVVKYCCVKVMFPIDILIIYIFGGDWIISIRIIVQSVSFVIQNYI